MLIEGYGKTMGRPGLDLARRELCVAVQVAIQGAGPQLHSHLRGARHAGVGPLALAEAIEVVRPLLGPAEVRLAAELLEQVSR
jgi:4-carboxymuconolactone decarboxylase